MKIKKIIQLIILPLILYSCGMGVKDALQGKKRSEKSDEFLVQKKNPLVLPPTYDDLPVPSSDFENQEILNQDDSLEVKKILELNLSENQNGEKNSKINISLEKSILEKINN